MALPAKAILPWVAMWAVLGLLAVAFFWGYFLGPLRKLFQALARGVRSARRRPGARCCPECASELADAAEGRLAFAACPGCSGKWLAEQALTEALNRKGRAGRSWHALDGEAAAIPCPVCSAGMPAGRLQDEDFTVYRCSACSGLWLGRIEWVSLQLRVLE